MRKESIHNVLMFSKDFIIIKKVNFIFLFPNNLKYASEKHSELFRKGEEDRYEGIQSYIFLVIVFPYLGWPMFFVGKNNHNFLI